MNSHTRRRQRHLRLGLLTILAFMPLPAAVFNCKLFPSTFAVDPSLTGNSDGNGLLEPGETVDVEPSWSKSRT